MNRIKRRLAIAKMDLMVFKAISGPIPRLTKWQKLKYCAECIFRWKKKSIVMARGISKPGLAWTRWAYELTGEFIPPPWVITDDETEGEDTT